jgi:hypothetical protein
MKSEQLLACSPTAAFSTLHEGALLNAVKQQQQPVLPDARLALYTVDYHASSGSAYEQQ